MQFIRYYMRQLNDLEKATTSFDKEIQLFRKKFNKIESEHQILLDELKAFLKKVKQNEM